MKMNHEQLLNENITSWHDVLSSEPLIESLIWKQ